MDDVELENVSKTASTPAPLPPPLLNFKPSPKTMQVTAFWDDAQGNYSAYVQFASDSGDKLAVVGQLEEKWTDAAGALLLKNTFNLAESDYFAGTTGFGTPVFVARWSHAPVAFFKSTAPYPSDVTIHVNFAANTGEEWKELRGTTPLRNEIIDQTPNSLEFGVSKDDGQFITDMKVLTKSGTATTPNATLVITWVDALGKVLDVESVDVSSGRYTKDYSFSDPSFSHKSPFASFAHSYAKSYSNLAILYNISFSDGRTAGPISRSTTLASSLEANLSERLMLDVVNTAYRCKSVSSYSGQCYSSAWSATVRLRNIGEVSEAISSVRLSAHTVSGAEYDWAGDDSNSNVPSSLDPGAFAIWTSYFDVPDGGAGVDKIFYSNYDGDSLSAGVS